MPTAAAGLEARLLSGDERRRAEAAALYRKRVHEYKGTRRALLAALGQALRAARICAFSQGMAAIRAGSDEHGWGIELREMARIWTAGCILRSRLLEDIMRAYERAPRLDNLLLDSEFREVVRGCEPGWRHAVATGIELGVPLPALGASLAYFDALTSAHLPQNLTQAQRDYFGAHTYRRTDDPEGGAVHTDWQRLARRVVVPPGRAG